MTPRLLVALLTVATFVTLSACAPAPRKARKATPVAIGWTERGRASWYGPGFDGRLTAAGERFNRHGLTAAHRTLPFGTRVRVRHERSGRTVVVRINDRGPFARGRIIDLAEGAARLLGIISEGIATVQIEVVK